ncbi:MAG: 3-hydroxyacyl-CoA dehydrogenase NAD-binding domain-containing protein [Chitinophagales bacterium]
MKKLENIKRIAVVGAGTMGSGIAQLAAQAGYETVLYDLTNDLVRDGLEIIRNNLSEAIERKKISAEEKSNILWRIKITNDFSELVADVVIEAIVERLETKSELFNKLAVLTDDDEAIFCTNTSSIPITKIARDIPHPERLVGMHFFNPAHLMKLVEIVSGTATSDENAQTVFDLAKKFGKEPVMARDAPGFIVNRVGKMFHTESLKILEENSASVETIDALLESSGFKMGPFRLIDLIGVDVNLSVTKSLYEQFHYEPRFAPSNIQQQLVSSGFLGKKSGRGFYQY